VNARPHPSQVRRGATALAILSFVLASSVVAQTRFADGEFDPADWTFVEVDTNEGGSVTTEPITDGNPGAALRIAVTINTAAAFSQITGVWLWHETYDPAIHGPFAAIDYADDSRAFQISGNGHATGLAIRQNGSIYIKRVDFTPEHAWTPKVERGLTTSAAFARLTGTSTLDFSPTAPPLEVGFYRAMSHPSRGGGTGTRTADIDNWSVTFQPPCASDADCGDPATCSTGACVAGVCQTVVAGCDDGVLCTVDQCSAGACEHTLATDFATVGALLETVLARIESSPCGTETVVRKVVRKVRKSLNKARMRLTRADRTTRERRFRRLVAKAQALLARGRALISTAVGAGLISSACGGELTALIAEIELCVGGLPAP